MLRRTPNSLLSSSADMLGSDTERFDSDHRCGCLARLRNRSNGAGQGPSSLGKQWPLSPEHRSRLAAQAGRQQVCQQLRRSSASQTTSAEPPESDVCKSAIPHDVASQSLCKYLPKLWRSLASSLCAFWRRVRAVLDVTGRMARSGRLAHSSAGQLQAHLRAANPAR